MITDIDTEWIKENFSVHIIGKQNAEILYLNNGSVFIEIDGYIYRIKEMEKLKD